MTTLYISGVKCLENESVTCPLQSSVVLFIAKYCHSNIKIVFVKDSDDFPLETNICTYEIPNLSNFTVEFSSWKDLPPYVKNVSLPSIHQPEHKLIRSGLCVVLRHIIRDKHNKNPELNLIDLLGFRQGSMKMCAEVSSWTKLCEVDIPMTVTQFIKDLRSIKPKSNTNIENRVTIPIELLTLDSHFQKKCKVHNDNKRQRASVAQLKDSLTKCIEEFEVDGTEVMQSDQLMQRINKSRTKETEQSQQAWQLNSINFDQSYLRIEKTVELSHGVTKFKVNKNLRATENIGKDACRNDSTSEKLGSCNGEIVSNKLGETKEGEKTFDLSELKSVINELTFTDIDYEHIYSEGTELTIADLILITYIYSLLTALDNLSSNLSSHLHQVLQWTSHMTSLSKVLATGQGLGWHWSKLTSICNQTELETSEKSIMFVVPECCEDKEEEELSRCAKMKHKALKPEVIQALHKFENVGISPLVGNHPKGEKVKVDWESMPDGVHPKEGHVPVKRTERKCQQLENLATAVETVAQPGDIIVDFCSGGGHLGILCAYLFPHCQVYLVENKEESLLKSSGRLDSLGLTNVTLYQCNMDYFVGKFDVGLCLHACGSATDMVLELCTKSNAAFVICPCCYGGIHNTHLLSYPRSQRYVKADISYTDFMTVGHAADQTEFDIKLEKQGRECMNLVDTDRAEYARENGYNVTLCHLQPMTCSPKNNLLIGTRS